VLAANYKKCHVIVVYVTRAICVLSSSSILLCSRPKTLSVVYKLCPIQLMVRASFNFLISLFINDITHGQSRLVFPGALPSLAGLKRFFSWGCVQSILSFSVKLYRPGATFLPLSPKLHDVLCVCVDMKDEGSVVSHSIRVLGPGGQLVTPVSRLPLLSERSWPTVFFVAYFFIGYCVCKLFCLTSFHLSVCLSHAGILWKQQNISSDFFYRWIAKPF